MRLLVALILVASLAGLGMISGAGASTSPADDRADDRGEVWSAGLKDLRASYEVERWKYDTAYEGQAAPGTVIGHIQNQTSSYYGAVGLRATLSIEIFDTTNPAATAGTNYNVTARIPTVRGDLYALVKRDGTSNRFFLDFDMDGANNGDPTGRTPPPADPGLQNVAVTILRRYVDTQTTGKVGEANFQFTYEIPAQAVAVPAFGGVSYQQGVPDSIFRLFNDVGYDRFVHMVTRDVNASTILQVAYDFGPAAANQSVELYSFLAERGVATGGTTQPAPTPNLPFIPGVSDNETLQKAIENTDRLTIVSRARIASSLADAEGRVSFQLTGAALLTARDPPPSTALTVLAPLLTSNFRAADCPGTCTGGAQFRIGATEAVVPVSNHRALIDGYRLADPGITGSGAPPQVRDVALSVNSLQVFVRDLEGFLPPDDLRSGDAWALIPDAPSTEPLSGGSLSPNQRETEAGQRQNLLAGNLAVRSIQAQHVSAYRVMALLYARNDAYYGMTWGDRGYELALDAETVEVPPGDGGVDIFLQSRTTNYDLLGDEPGFDLKVILEINIPDFNVNETKTVTLKEGGTYSELYPVNAEAAGQVTVRVASTSGDVLPNPREVSVVFEEVPDEESLADKIPGFDAAFVLAALAALALIGWRRRR